MAIWCKGGDVLAPVTGGLVQWGGVDWAASSQAHCSGQWGGIVTAGAAEGKAGLLTLAQVDPVVVMKIVRGSHGFGLLD